MIARKQRQIGIAATLAALTAVVTVGAASAASSLTLSVTSPPHFSAAAGACAAGHVADTVATLDGATVGSLDGCFLTFESTGDGGDSFTATYTFDLAGGRILTTLSGRETPTATGVVMAVTGTITGGTGIFSGASGTISGGGPIDFTVAPIRPNLTFVLSFA